MFSFCICDDDENITREIREALEIYARDHGMTFSINIWNDSSNLDESMQSSASYDFYILDIIMPLTGGLELAGTIRKHDLKAHIIFLTSSGEFALDSYEFHADAYLIKPIDPDKLFAELDRIFMDISLKDTEMLTLSFKSSTRTIPVDSIVSMEARRNKVLFTLNNGDSFEIYATFSEMESQLIQHTAFARVHRSYVINMNYIKEIISDDIVLADRQRIPLSNTYVREFKESYLAYLGSLQF